MVCEGGPLTRTWICALALLSAAAGAAAQEKSVGRDFEAGFKDILWVWSSPLRIEEEDLVALGLVAGAAGGTLLLDEQIRNFLQDHPRSLPVLILTPFRESSPINLIGRTKLLQPLSAAMYVAGWAFDEPDLRAAGIGCAATNFSNTIARHFMALLLGRKRPELEEGPWQFQPLAFGEWENRSFPGGHAANAITCVSFWNHRFDLGAAEPLLYMLGGLVGFARLLDDAHWTSDTVVGVSLGIAVGKGVAGRQLDRRAGGSGAIFNVGVRLRF